MCGKNHIVAASCSLVLLYETAKFLEKSYNGAYASQVHMGLNKVFNYLACPTQIPKPVWLISCILLFIIGTLLPDIDNEKSMLGKLIYIPIEHRTWTHTIWIVALIGILATWYAIFIWLVAGYFIHLFWDSVSYCGVCFFYPISRYRKYPSGAKVKKKHILKLYRTEKTSEYVLVAIIVTITIFTTVESMMQHVISFGIVSELVI